MATKKTSKGGHRCKESHYPVIAEFCGKKLRKGCLTCGDLLFGLFKQGFTVEEAEIILNSIEDSIYTALSRGEKAILGNFMAFRVQHVKVKQDIEKVMSRRGHYNRISYRFSPNFLKELNGSQERGSEKAKKRKTRI